MIEKSVGIVETKSYTFASESDPFVLESGKSLKSVTLAFETYGELSENKDNAILIAHAFSGNAHAAGKHNADDKHFGWWEMMIGPGKPIDTDRYFVICSNVLGGCSGSTGPSSVNPDTGKPYALDFPMVTIKDIVNAQKKLLEELKIDRLLSVIGGSMGGMQVLQWVASYPEMIESAIPMATALKHSPQQIAFDEVARQSIMADVEWKNGDYYGSTSPEKGLAVARMVGHITYMSDVSMEKKFSRRLKSEKFQFDLKTDFEVEGYLQYRGATFVGRFDANSYLYITKAMDYFDLSGNKLFPEGKTPDIRFLVISFTSDWLYPSYQALDIVKQLRVRHMDTTYCDIETSHGHDSFLIENSEQKHLVRHFLNNLYSDIKERDAANE